MASEQRVGTLLAAPSMHFPLVEPCFFLAAPKEPLSFGLLDPTGKRQPKSSRIPAVHPQRGDGREAEPLPILHPNGEEEVQLCGRARRWDGAGTSGVLPFLEKIHLVPQSAEAQPELGNRCPWRRTGCSKGQDGGQNQAIGAPFLISPLSPPWMPLTLGLILKAGWIHTVRTFGK